MVNVYMVGWSVAWLVEIQYTSAQVEVKTPFRLLPKFPPLSAFHISQIYFVSHKFVPHTHRKNKFTFLENLVVLVIFADA